MRLRSVLSEALRNIGAGVSHAMLMFAAVLFASTLLGGYEAVNVVELETEAVQRINAYADVNAIVGGNGGRSRMRRARQRWRRCDEHLGRCDAC